MSYLGISLIIFILGFVFLDAMFYLNKALNQCCLCAQLNFHANKKIDSYFQQTKLTLYMLCYVHEHEEGRLCHSSRSSKPRWSLFSVQNLTLAHRIERIELLWNVTNNNITTHSCCQVLLGQQECHLRTKEKG